MCAHRRRPPAAAGDNNLHREKYGKNGRNEPTTVTGETMQMQCYARPAGSFLRPREPREIPLAFRAPARELQCRVQTAEAPGTGRSSCRAGAGAGSSAAAGRQGKWQRGQMGVISRFVG